MAGKKDSEQFEQSDSKSSVSETAEQTPGQTSRERSAEPSEPKSGSESGTGSRQRDMHESDNLESSGTAEEAFRAAERLTAGPELNDHGTKAYDARESTGRKATEDWKKKKPEAEAEAETEAEPER